MMQAILDEVAYLFVEVFDNRYGMLTDRSDVKRIRKAADDGEDGLYAVVASVFGESLDSAFTEAAFGAMDYIAYTDETWTPKDADDKARVLEVEQLHLESLKALLHMAQQNQCNIADQIRDIQREAEKFFQHLQEKQIKIKAV